ncbi:MAG TPA: 1-deoxy-D-xylulose-5-phosphate reductoisomerase [Rectinemataceae bacterium]|nr:1-deoxy-D-xylulose-5-phosphate reductoisomerase [Rectinemataceae bacterium]
MKKRVIVIGATGSIGRQTLDVIRSRPDLFQVVGLSAHSSEGRLLESGQAFPGAVLALGGAAPHSDRIALHGSDGVEKLIRSVEADIVVNGAAGSGGLRISLAALESGKDLALANKESVVMGWGLLHRSAELSSRKILPVDSEHAALFQLIQRVGAEEIEELTITASGGAFRNLPLEELAKVTPDQAAAHPNWSMGRKITIDSATMANKGLEVIEASRLFDVPGSKVKVLIHPQSIVHALVRTRDGTLYAQLSEPDMRVPIQNALTWPDTLPCPFGRLELAGKSLEFKEVDPVRYPFLELAYKALAMGEGATVALNAADEVAVEAFEKGALGFTDIATIVDRTLDRPWPTRLEDLGSIFDVDSAARDAAQRELAEC